MEIVKSNSSILITIQRSEFNSPAIGQYRKYVTNLNRFIYQNYTCRVNYVGNLGSGVRVTITINGKEWEVNISSSGEWKYIDGFDENRQSLSPTSIPVNVYTTGSIDHLQIEFETDNSVIYCYNNNVEDITVFKMIKNLFHLTGIFRDSVDLINPTFEIEYPEVPTFNYVFLNMFGRYYFVDSIECVRNGLYRVYCSIDVLMSYNEQLPDLEVYVTRQENNINLEIPDMKLPIQSNVEYILDNPYVNFHSGIGFPVSRDLKAYYYALTVVSVSPYYKTSEQYRDVVPTVYNKTSVTLLLTAETLDVVINKILGSTDVVTNIKSLWNDSSDAFISLKQFPWDLVNALNIPSTNANKWLIGSKIIDFEQGIRGVTLTDKEKVFFERPCGSYKFVRKYNDWRDFKPYTKISLYIPFVGWVELDNEEIYSDKYQGADIYFKYVIDLISGDGIFQIYNYIQNDVAIPEPDTYEKKYIYINIIAQYSCNPCDNVLISNSNHLEMLRKGISLGTNLLSSGVSAMVTGGANLEMANAMNMKQKGVNRTSKELAIDKARVRQARASNISNATNIISDFTSGVISDSKGSKVFSTNSNGFLNLDTRTDFLIKYERFVYKEPTGYAHILGKPSSYKGRLGDLKGYTEVGAFHLEGINGITTKEKNLLEDLLRSGIIM